MFSMLRFLIFALISVTIIALVIGTEPSCKLMIGGQVDACQTGQGESLTQHLAHASVTYPDIHLAAFTTILAFILWLLTRWLGTGLPNSRLLSSSPEQPPRFA